MIRWKITRVEGRQRDTGAAMVDGLHHGLKPGGVELALFDTALFKKMNILFE